MEGNVKYRPCLVKSQEITGIGSVMTKLKMVEWTQHPMDSSDLLLKDVVIACELSDIRH